MKHAKRAVLLLSPLLLFWFSCGSRADSSAEDDDSPIYISRFARTVMPVEWGIVPPSEERIRIGGPDRALYFSDEDRRIVWLSAGEIVEHRNTPMAPPFTERVWIDPDKSGAFGYQFTMARGHRYHVAFRFDESFRMVERSLDQDDQDAAGDEPVRAAPPRNGLLVELYQLNNKSAEQPVIVSSAEIGPVGREQTLVLEPMRTGVHLVRIQAYPGAGGLVDVAMATDSAYVWPVEGTTAREILGVWGDPREGGRRIHEGIDIWGDYGTPLFAMTDAYVLSVRESERGGNSVILYDPERKIRAYYGHLQDIKTEAGSYVSEGDQIGTVGATGNANPLYPHLHIGLSDALSGIAFDPMDFFVSPDGIRVDSDADPAAVLLENELAPALAASGLEPGSWVRVTRDLSYVAAAPGVRERFLGYDDGYIQDGTLFRVFGGTGNLVRLERPDTQSIIYLPRDSLSVADSAVSTVKIDAVRKTFPRPQNDSRYADGSFGGRINSVQPGEYEVYGYYSDFAQIDADGNRWWIRR